LTGKVSQVQLHSSMKSVLKIILLASLLGNVFLVIRILLKEQRDGSLGAPAMAATQRESASPLAQASAAKDLGSIVTLLRKGGLSREMIQYIVAGLLQREVTARRQKMLADVPYWRNLSPEQRQLLRDDTKRIRSRFAELFGEEAATAAFDSRDLERRYGFGGPKATQVRGIESDYSEMKYSIENDAALSPKERSASLEKLSAEMRKDLESVLSPEELRAYDLRNSPASAAVLRSLGGLNVSESQFASLVAAQQKYTASVADTRMSNARDRVFDAQSSLFEDARNALDEEQFLKYLKANDQLFNSINGFAQQNGIASQTAYQVAQLQRSAGADLARIGSDATLSPAEQSEARTRVAALYLPKIVELFGPAEAQAYQKSPWGHWLSATK
jgi:hypothetical protein